MMSPYLRASSVRLFPFRPTRLRSGVCGAESTPPDPILLSLAEARLPVVSLVADMISWSCLCRFSLMARDSDIWSGERRNMVINNLLSFLLTGAWCMTEVNNYHFHPEHHSSPLCFHHWLGVQLLHPPRSQVQTNKKYENITALLIAFCDSLFN